MNACSIRIRLSLSLARSLARARARSLSNPSSLSLQSYVPLILKHLMRHHTSESARQKKIGKKVPPPYAVPPSM